MDEGVAVHIVNITKKLTLGWENKTEDSVVVDMELKRAFEESARKSLIIRAGLKAVKHSDGWAGVLPFWLHEGIDEHGKTIKGSNGYTIVEIPEKADLVREIFRLAAQGLGAKRILQDSRLQRGIKCGIALVTVGEAAKESRCSREHQPLAVSGERCTVPDGDPVLKFPRIVDQSLIRFGSGKTGRQEKDLCRWQVSPATGSHNSGEASNLV